MASDVLKTVCKLQRRALPLFILNLTLFLVLLGVFPFVERGSATFYISLLSFATIGGPLLLWTGLIYTCNRIEEEETGFLERES